MKSKHWVIALVILCVSHAAIGFTLGHRLGIDAARSADATASTEKQQQAAPAAEPRPQDISIYGDQTSRLYELIALNETLGDNAVSTVTSKGDVTKDNEREVVRRVLDSLRAMCTAHQELMELFRREDATVWKGNLPTVEAIAHKNAMETSYRSRKNLYNAYMVSSIIDDHLAGLPRVLVHDIDSCDRE